MYIRAYEPAINFVSTKSKEQTSRLVWCMVKSGPVFYSLAGPDVVQWVDLLYAGVQSAVNVNGYLSSFFSLTRGVRQGCPFHLSCMSFTQKFLPVIPVPTHPSRVLLCQGNQSPSW